MTQDKEPLVSVVIATRDRAAVLEQCLEHLMAQEGGSLETIVVDNSVDQQSTRAIVVRFPGVTYLRANPNKRNPALMRNMGIQASHGDILAFIDDDTLVAPGWLQAIREAFADPQVGGVTGRVIEADAAEVCTTEIGRFSPRGEITMNFNNTIDCSVPVEFLYGCNMALHRKSLTMHGLFDPWLMMAYEDTEIGLRIGRQGDLILFWPTLIAHHLKWRRPEGVARRSSDFDLTSIFGSCRSLAYLCVSQYGLRRDFAKVAFVNLPKGAMRKFIDKPSVRTMFGMPVIFMAVISGYTMAALRFLGFHAPPSLSGGQWQRPMSIIPFTSRGMRS